MIFDIHKPSYPLNQFIEFFIYYKDYNPDHSIDRLLPDGNVNVIFDLTDYPKFIYDNDSLKEIQSCRNVWFSGMRSRYISIPSGKDSEMFVINFLKGKAYPFAEMPMHALNDSVVDGELVMTGEILRIREKLLNCSNSIQMFTVVEQSLLRSFGKKLHNNPFTEYAVNQLISNPQEATLSRIAVKAGYSQKHLLKIFKDHVGLTPKALLKVMRFQKALSDIDAGKFTNWAGVAFDSGYYDQAHFINDFKSFSGFTPNEYLRTKSDYLNYVAIG